MAHQLAKGLASLGRNGDSMLMHVSPSEVNGLRALGAMTGREITTNPHTGMPEAFSFGDFFTSLLPTLVGVALAPETGGASLGLTGSMAQAAPVLGGMAAGAAVAGAKGDDPLLGGIMGGLGGYGGGGLGNTFAKMGAGNIATAGGAIPENAIAATPIDATQLSQQIGGANLTGAVAPGSAVATAPMTYTQSLGQVGQGIKQLASDPFGKGYEAFKAAGGSPMQLAAPIGLAALSGAQEDLYPEPDMSMEEKRKAEENKYRDPRTGLLNLSASPGLRLAAEGGLMNSYALGGTVTTGGLSNLYNSTDMQSNPSLSRDGYGIGRLENLAAEGSKAKAADSFYAMGGPIAFSAGGQKGYLDGPGDGMSDSIPATIEGKQPARLADGEFVIPADVVSHLGNGSTKAGSKRLYAMLDKVRQARTGTKKQGKEIKPEKYMPA